MPSPVDSHQQVLSSVLIAGGNNCCHFFREFVLIPFENRRAGGLSYAVDASSPTTLKSTGGEFSVHSIA